MSNQKLVRNKKPSLVTSKKTKLHSNKSTEEQTYFMELLSKINIFSFVKDYDDAELNKKQTRTTTVIFYMLMTMGIMISGKVIDPTLDSYTALFIFPTITTVLVMVLSIVTGFIVKVLSKDRMTKRYTFKYSMIIYALLMLVAFIMVFTFLLTGHQVFSENVGKLSGVLISTYFIYVSVNSYLERRYKNIEEANKMANSDSDFDPEFLFNNEEAQVSPISRKEGIITTITHSFKVFFVLYVFYFAMLESMM